MYYAKCAGQERNLRKKRDRTISKENRNDKIAGDDDDDDVSDSNSIMNGIEKKRKKRQSAKPVALGHFFPQYNT